MTYHLVAFAVNATCYDRAEVEWALAAQGPDSNWYDWNGQRLYPFFSCPINCPELSIPEGWIEHVHAIARRDTCQRTEPVIDLAEVLGLKSKQPPKPFARRI